MKFLKKLLFLFSIALILIFTVLIIIKPSFCRDGVIKGILICGRIVIPSLFPFTMCVLFIMKSGIFSKLSFATPVFKTLFGISAEQFTVMLLSFIGGYPIGAKLIDQAVSQKNISKKNGSVMLNYCINAGPAFIIGAVGTGFINSKKIGYILFSAHILASLTICIISRFFTEKNDKPPRNINKSISVSDNFTQSAAEAAVTLFNISAFVILFSAINSYLDYFSSKFTFLKYILYFSEVTNGISYTNNIFMISFMLGVSGICVWCQVFSCTKSLKINLGVFILSRLLHGSLSVLFTKILLKLTKTSVTTFSCGKAHSFEALYSTPALAISLLSMTVIFLLSLNNKKYTLKILEDIV